MRRMMSAALLCAVAGGVSAGSGGVDLDRYLKQESFTDVKLSPGGDYLAATVPLEDATALVILRTSDRKPAGVFRPQAKNHAYSFDWVSNDRVLVGLAEKWGALDQPRPTGELYAVNADGNRGELLVGYRVQGRGAGTRIQPKKVEDVAAFLTDDLPGDDRNVLIAVWPFSDEPYTRVERLDVQTGQRVRVSGSPVRRAEFATDAQGNVRFAHGAASDNISKLYYRASNGASWELLNDEGVTHRVDTPIGFSADGTLAYLQVQQPQGPDAIVSWNPQTRERVQVLRDEQFDPSQVIYQPGTRVPVGALILGDTPRTRFFDEQGPDARQYRSLEAAFGGPVFITSSTRDGSKVVVQTWSGSIPGEFYLYDTKAKNAEFLISRSEWIDPKAAASVRPFSLKSRDGLTLHGFLTLPHGSDGRNLPMVVVPHGGPISVFDDGSYDPETQLLADAGYAVLQVNFRGSGNQGRAFKQLAAEQWGRTMQDDVTDATRWAIAEGIANKDRICIYGASYGGYAALMGPIREPGLYQCAAGYVGIYDLPLRFTKGAAQSADWGMTWLRDWMGDPKTLGAYSPTTLAAQVKVPVFLAAGGEDQNAPIEHTKRMEAALKKVGSPVEALYYSTEGHGFYRPEHRREYYTRLLAFLSNSLGGATASAATPTGSGKAP
ncbi:S9 family peptidase [Stenotrophomonas sp. ZAC14D1_NAIMI4_6]|uniref:alpha/beta hydrolase family protein n=1 Tax=Stenotrophomonas TaxID=40323 RepID=UPI0009A16ACB|nr:MULTISPECIES: S9 family peptidase [Stenotrophomonas]AWH36275.1 S9 family peptidase [Stenotrophomonas sp. ZAC14D1_NAIMI4_6]AWH40466.1 S9 family peptidase [Stenotrophomonas sp. ZAC14D1_NAIMI4_1]